MSGASPVRFVFSPRFWCAWLVLCLSCGLLGGLFLWSLGLVTRASSAHSWLMYFLPVSGLAMHALYRWDDAATHREDEAASGGGHSLARTLRGCERPLRHLRPLLAPLIFFSTLATHLCGGSAGREGTALQMGGGLAAVACRWSGGELGRRILTACGMAGCFAAVFGTPLAAAFFCWELSRWQKDLRIGVPLIFASAWIANVVCATTGAVHTDFAALVSSAVLPWMSPVWWGKCLLLMASCAAVVWMFHFAMASFTGAMRRWVKRGWLRPVMGGAMVIALVFLLGTVDYLGLGVDARRAGGVCLISAFSADGSEWWSWLAKLLFTVVTLGSGFKGGEVTPLFFAGACLGNTLACMVHAPVGNFAAAAMMAVFAGASRCPIACIFMGCELFGWQHAPLHIVTCLGACLMSRSKGIYDGAE